MDAAQYCRQVETYLCRKNDGHLIRVVGPAFQLVTGWATAGIPLKIACGGIDRYFERYYAKGPRRRPVRIEFCEADVLDLFDQWRRAVGVSSVTAIKDSERRPRSGLQKHVQRVLLRLTALMLNPDLPQPFRDRIQDVSQDLEASGAAEQQWRGAARAQVIERLGAHDRALVDALRDTADASRLSAMERDARAELQPFRDRMPPSEFETAVMAAVDRLLREDARLPMVRYE